MTAEQSEFDEYFWHRRYRVPQEALPWKFSTTGAQLHYVVSEHQDGTALAACGRTSAYVFVPGEIARLCAQCVDRLHFFVDDPDAVIDALERVLPLPPTTYSWLVHTRTPGKQ